MAQRSNVSIPARFSFRPCNAKWSICKAVTVGWFQIESPEKYFLFPLGLLDPRRDAVLISVEVPLLHRDFPPGTRPPDWAQRRRVVNLRVNRSCIPTQVLSTDENPKATPAIEGREFHVLVCAKREFEADLWPVLIKPEGGEKDAWEMRDEFLNLGNNDRQLCAFLNQWGLWEGLPGFQFDVRDTMTGFVAVFPQALQERRDFFRRGLVSSPQAWLSSTNPLSLDPVTHPPYYMVNVSYCDDAIKATISVDHLLDVRFGICKREDCGKIFTRTNRHVKLYCTSYCGHLSSLRKKRAQKRSAVS